MFLRLTFAISPFLLLTGSPSAQVCDAAAFGSTTQDPLIITGTWTIGDGCVLDFGLRHVILEGTLNVQRLSLYAAQLTIAPAGKIEGKQSKLMMIIINAANGWDGSLFLQGALTNNGNVEQFPHGSTSYPGGTIECHTAGDLRIADGAVLEATGIISKRHGGVIRLSSGGDLTLHGPRPFVDVSAAPDIWERGGEVDLRASGRILANRGIRASGHDGGKVDILSTTASVILDAPIDCNSSYCDSGGEIYLQAAQDLIVSGPLSCNSKRRCGYYAFGDGGSVVLEAGGSIRLSARVTAQGKGREGGSRGGEFLANCGGDYLQTAEAVVVSSLDYDGLGGNVEISALGSIQLLGNHFADGTANRGYGGHVTINAGRDLLVAGGIFARGFNPGEVSLSSAEGSADLGGAIHLEGLGAGGSGGALSVLAGDWIRLAGVTIRGEGSGSGGKGSQVELTAGLGIVMDGESAIQVPGNLSLTETGGRVQLTACQIDLKTGSQITTLGGVSGEIALTAGDGMRISGELRADGATVTLTSRLPSPYSPVITGATIIPAPSIVHDFTIPPCLALDALELTARSPVSVGAAETIDLDIRSVPDAKVVVLADFTPAYLPAGRYGYLQLDPATAYRIADAGYFGAPIAGSTTDAQGAWSFTSSPITNAALIGRTLYVEALVRDPQARNGWFHQTPLAIVDFVP